MLRKILFLILLFPAVAFSCTTGEKLTQRYWKEVKAKNTKAFASQVSYHFQGLDANGLVTRKHEIMPYSLTSYFLGPVRTTKAGTRLVVTYDMNQIVGFTSTYWHQLQAYEKREGHWKLIADSWIQFFPK